VKDSELYSLFRNPGECLSQSIATQLPIKGASYYILVSIKCSICECGTIYSMWIILRKYEGGCEARLAKT